MAHPIEEKLMNQLNLCHSYHYSNGSMSCRHIRREAVDKLPVILTKNEFTVSKNWIEIVKKAEFADSCADSDESILTNTWMACSYAIQDAIYRKENGEDKGLCPNLNFLKFEDDKHKARYTQTTPP